MPLIMRYRKTRQLISTRFDTDKMIKYQASIIILFYQ